MHIDDGEMTSLQLDDGDGADIARKPTRMALLHRCARVGLLIVGAFFTGRLLGVMLGARSCKPSVINHLYDASGAIFVVATLLAAHVDAGRPNLLRFIIGLEVLCALYAARPLGLTIPSLGLTLGEVTSIEPVKVLLVLLNCVVVAVLAAILLCCHRRPRAPGGKTVECEPFNDDDDNANVRQSEGQLGRSTPASSSVSVVWLRATAAHGDDDHLHVDGTDVLLGVPAQRLLLLGRPNRRLAAISASRTRRHQLLRSGRVLRYTEAILRAGRSDLRPPSLLRPHAHGGPALPTARLPSAHVLLWRHQPAVRLV
eukprot:2625549-Prymnesium_polylepis.2